ncbi:3-oxoadipate enol-lactonase [Methylobacterium sp. WL64]|uniref:3-oxoadipate enol-lactonase n=1 Tax=Methylobacterium sp. WL64 TaxID=2603894 RepID=UPI0011C88E80|nr:3-oxoadipate enol-lactonase [Methylobacterium sp. WL64]TXN00157.1 3-oxoadipate enol-lactonase [Methylobacterium sp. WL64]
MDDTSHFTTGDGCRVAFRLDGSARHPILMLSNSIATDLRMWDGEMEPLTRHFRVLRYDLRGHGGSAVPPGGYSLDRLGRDVIELLDHLGIERVHFCGTSIGGFIGQWLGIHSPERIDRLVLSNTSPHVGPPSQWDEMIRQTLASHIATTADILLKRWFSERMFVDRPETVSKFHEMIVRTPPLGIAGCLAAIRDTDLRRTVPLIPVPTMVIGGEDDTPTIPTHSRAIAEAVPGAELHFLPGIHMLCAEHPREYPALLLDFLCRSGSAS